MDPENTDQTQEESAVIDVDPTDEGVNTPKDEKEELRDLLLRTQADFENYRKQTERRVDDIRKMASKHVLVQLLSVVDHIELALKSAAAMDTKHSLFEGVELIYSELQMLLVNNGLVEIEAQGKKYDPYFHEALMKVDSSEPENTIVEIYQKGYLLHGHVIRHTKVKISNGSGSKESTHKKK